MAEHRGGRLNRKKFVGYSSAAVGLPLARAYVAAEIAAGREAYYHDTIFGAKFKRDFNLGNRALTSEENEATSDAFGLSVQGKLRMFNAQNPASTSYWVTRERAHVQRAMDRGTATDILHMSDDGSEVVAEEDKYGQIRQRGRRSATPPNTSSSTSVRPPPGSTEFGSGYWRITDGRYWKAGVYYDMLEGTSQDSRRTVRQSRSQSPPQERITRQSPQPSPTLQALLNAGYQTVQGRPDLMWHSTRRQYYMFMGNQLMPVQPPARNCKRQGGCPKNANPQTDGAELVLDPEQTITGEPVIKDDDEWLRKYVKTFAKVLRSSVTNSAPKTGPAETQGPNDGPDGPKTVKGPVSKPKSPNSTPKEPGKGSTAPKTGPPKGGAPPVVTKPPKA